MKPSGWMDDFWTIVLALPLLLAFLPGAQGLVSRGFQLIAADAPAWYLAAVGSAIAWVFGKRILPPRR